MTHGEEVVRFTGPVTCLLDDTGPLGLTMVGRAGDASVQVSLQCSAPRDFPSRLESAAVLRLGADRVRVTSAGLQRELVARRTFVHRNASAALQRALPPRSAPLGKRLFWRAVLLLAATPAARLLFALRR